MTRFTFSALTLSLACLMALTLSPGIALAQDGPPQRGERGERPQRGGDRGDMMSRMLDRDPSEGFVGLLSELNMTPEFTLSPEQKTKIRDLREKFITDRRAFVTDHKKEFDYLTAQMTEARTARDREAMGEAMESLRDLMAKGPTGDKLLEDLKAVLTDTQRKAVDQRLEEREQRMREWREQRQRGRDGGENNDEGPVI